MTSNNPYGLSAPFGGLTTDEQRARSRAAEDAAIRVFGDDQPAPFGGWIFRASHEFGEKWQSPSTYAAESDEALARVVARLEELSKTVDPVWDPRPKGGRNRASKARR